MVHQVHQAADVTPLLLAAWNRHEVWSYPVVNSILEKFRLRFEGVQIDWEPGDEEWASLLMQQHVEALICSRMPLAIIKASVIDVVRRDLPDELVVLVMPSFSTPTLIIDRATAEMVFERALSDNVDWGGMSARDFWWATV